MIDTIRPLPFYIKAAVILMGGYFLMCILYTGADIILPLLYAIMIAILLSPLVHFLVKRNLNRALSVAAVLISAILLAGGIIALVASQANLLNHAWPKLMDKFHSLSDDCILWASSCFNVSVEKINDAISDEKNELIKHSGAAMGVLTTMTGILEGAILVPVYVFMILYYQPHLLAFLHKLFDAENDRKMSEILVETKSIVQSYLRGLFVEFIIISILNSISLFVLGVGYALLFGIAAAILNVIPLIGGGIGLVLFIAIVLVFKSPLYVLYITVMYTIIQFIDNHYIIPKIVGSKVKLNALVCVVVVIAANSLWGIPGMFLAIPLTAVIKLLLDRIDTLQPWGFMLGDAVISSSKLTFMDRLKNIFKSDTPADKAKGKV